jgi:hypothetical protein
LRERILPRHLDVIDKDTRDENIQYPTSELWCLYWTLLSITSW